MLVPSPPDILISAPSPLEGGKGRLNDYACFITLNRMPKNSDFPAQWRPHVASHGGSIRVLTLFFGADEPHLRIPVRYSHPRGQSQSGARVRDLDAFMLS